MSSVINHIKQLDLNKIYSYADYYSWKLKDRVELIKGRIFKMSPAPSVAHQRVSMKLSRAWSEFLIDKKCEVFAAPFDVRFPSKSKSDKTIFNVVQPDLCVICDPSKLDEKGCLGAPDIIVEILSPGNTEKELKNKYQLYLENKVKEYWIIHPIEETLLIYTYAKGHYIPSQLFCYSDEIKSKVFKDFTLNLNTVFTNE